MNELQSLFQSCGGALTLTPGEYAGPLVIDRPCVLDGQGAALWAARGPVLSIEAEPVTIRRLQVEVTGPDRLPPDGIAIRTQVPGVTLDTVEVNGALSGFAGESPDWDLPASISLGDFAAGRKNAFSFELDVPAPARLVSDSPLIHASPETLAPGVRTVTVELAPIPEGTLLHGSLFVVTGVARRIGVSGRALRRAPLRRAAYPLNPLAGWNPRDCALAVIYQDLSGTFDPMTVDSYSFLLDRNGKTRSDKDLIFFGNARSERGEVRAGRVGPWPAVQVQLSRADKDTAKIVVCFAVDDEHPDGVFQQPSLRVFANQEEKLCAELPARKGERLLIAAELTRDGDAWRMELAGTGYRAGLAALCRAYGMDVENE